MDRVTFAIWSVQGISYNHDTSDLPYNIYSSMGNMENIYPYIWGIYDILILGGVCRTSRGGGASHSVNAGTDNRIYARNILM